MAQSTGSPKPSNGSSPANGKTSSKTTGKTDAKASAKASEKASEKASSKMNGHKSSVRKRLVKKRSRIVPRLFSIFARLATWAVILTILFRCPSSLEACNEDSPVICEPYFRLKSFASPYVQPIYNQNVAPYLEVAKPYYEAVNTHLVTPARACVVRHGAPLVEKVNERVSHQWEKHGQPRFAQLQAQWAKCYDQWVAPHLTMIAEIFEPYYEIGRTALYHFYYSVLLPCYDLAQPYALQSYETAFTFAADKAVPAVHWTWNQTNTFLSKAVWPQLRIVYVENVEPQLVRIGERLERYKNKTGTGSKPKSQSEVPLRTSSSSSGNRPADLPSTRSSFSKPAPQNTASLTPGLSEKRPSPSSADAEKSVEAYWNPVKAPAPAENETEQRKRAREMVAEDLDMWQNKFAVQADEGAFAIEEHIDEIAQRMMAEEVVITGKALLKKLELAVESELDHLGPKLLSIIREHSHDDADVREAAEQLTRAIRSAGISVKHAAQAVRDWRETYDRDLQAAVLDAANVHFQILDETRALALQQIGMKWAWTDGVTYKDWAKYHELKKTLSEWTEELKKLIVTNPTLLEAQEASAQVEDDGMTIASAAAKELGRLKEAAHWKLLAKDTGDDFDLEAMKLAAEAAKRDAGSSSTQAEDAEAESQASTDGDELRTTSSTTESANQASASATASVDDITEDVSVVEDGDSEASAKSASTRKPEPGTSGAGAFDIQGETQSHLDDLFQEPVMEESTKNDEQFDEQSSAISSDGGDQCDLDNETLKGEDIFSGTSSASSLFHDAAT